MREADEQRTADTTNGEDSRTGSRRRLLRGHRGSIGLVLGGLGLLGLVVGGYGLLALRENWFPFHSKPPHAVSLNEARRRFRDNGAADRGGAHVLTPAPGVYDYRGSGSESLSSPARSQPEGPSLPGTVTHRSNDCWRFRLDYSSNHVRQWDFCVRDGTLVQVANRVSQRWDFGTFAIENVTTMTCDPAAVILENGMTPGEQWPAECRGENSRISGPTISRGTHRLVGTEKLDVGGTTVEAFHFADERTVSGSQSGTERFELWLSSEGLPLKGIQHIVVDSDSPLGRVTYTQDGEFSLTSTSPRG